MEIKIHATPIVKDGHKYLRVESPVRVIYPTAAGKAYADVLALWDTGATNTCIPMKVAVAMGIQLGEELPTRKIKTKVSSNRCQFYLQFHTGDKVFVSEALAVPNMQSQFVIGMDVISKGVTTIEPDGQDGVDFTFTL